VTQGAQNGRNDMTSQNAAAVRHHAVSLGTRMTLISGDDPVDVAAELFYTTHDPLAVHMGLAVDGAGAVEWVFSRDLLRDALIAPSGSGDIHIFPVPQGVVIDLFSPHGSARLLADALELADFVDEMYQTVADGDESRYMDLDAELAALQELQFPFL
jgi:hypothetical protein